MASPITLGTIELASGFCSHNIADQGKKHRNNSCLGRKFISLANLPRRNSASDDTFLLPMPMGLESQQVTREIVYSGVRRLGES